MYYSIISMGIGNGYFIYRNLLFWGQVFPIVVKFRFYGDWNFDYIFLLGCSNSSLWIYGIYMGRNIYWSNTHTSYAHVNGYCNGNIFRPLFYVIPINWESCFMDCFFMLPNYSRINTKYFIFSQTIPLLVIIIILYNKLFLLVVILMSVFHTV